MALANGYTYRRTITVDNTKVGGSTNISNFVLLFSGTYDYLADTSNSGKVESSSGYDIIFASDEDGDTLLDFERVSYDNTTGAITAWVEIPTLDYNDNTVIYVFYGKSGESDTSNANNTWASKYQGVWHLEEDVDYGDEGHIDSTSNDHDLTSKNASWGDDDPERVTGKIGYGQKFDGSGDWLEPVGDGQFTTGTEGTFSAWIYNQASATGTILGLGSGSNNVWRFNLVLESTNIYVGFYSRGVCTLRGGTALNQDTWYRLSVVCDGTSTKFYVNGVLESNTTISGTDNGQWFGDLTISGTAVSSIGMGYRWGARETYLASTVDEPQMTNTQLTAGQLLAEYNNQNSPSTFYALGAEDNGEGTGGINMQINIGDDWKEVTKIQVNIGDDWKEVTKIQQNIGDDWKEVF